MQDAGTPAPGLLPLRSIFIDGVHAGKVMQRGHCGLFAALTSQEVLRRVGQNDANGQFVLVGFQGLYDNGDFER